MIPIPRPRPSHLAAALGAALLVVGLAGPVAAKETVVATLEAPIAMDSPPGVVLLVAITATAPDADGTPAPVIGTPFYLKLTGPDGATTRAAAEATSTPGRYLMRIEVPPGGPREVEVGIHGSNQDGPMDLPVRLEGRTLAFGPIGEGTAQVDPEWAAEAARAAADATAAAPVPAPSAATLAPAAGVAGASDQDQAPVLAAAVVLAAVALAVVMLLLARRLASRRDGRSPVGDGARGG